MRKTILLIFAITFLQLNFSCKSQYSATELNNNFSNEQISDLNKITEFFKNQMCHNTNSDFKKCCKQIPHEYLQATGSGFWTNIDFEKQKELYENISKSTFDEIWMFCKSTELPSGKESKKLCAVTNGKYQKFLSDFGNENPRIAEYANKIASVGDFNGLDIHYQEILKNKDFDLNDPNVQLILAIHYLSLNDHEKRKEEWISE
ncbi:hypothetical protein [Confluentibacter lentus]|uniref:hypothetical protein n=1 Tax=Confluentibacter lentus TaxID=1699412 RepID=UPI000C2909B4|nr:hypothetical protein [Confluentibacter lentus]